MTQCVTHQFQEFSLVLFVPVVQFRCRDNTRYPHTICHTVINTWHWPEISSILQTWVILHDVAELSASSLQWCTCWCPEEVDFCARCLLCLWTNEKWQEWVWGHEKRAHSKVWSLLSTPIPDGPKKMSKPWTLRVLLRKKSWLYLAKIILVSSPRNPCIFRSFPLSNHHQ